MPPPSPSPKLAPPVTIKSLTCSTIDGDLSQGNGPCHAYLNVDMPGEGPKKGRGGDARPGHPRRGAGWGRDRHPSLVLATPGPARTGNALSDARTGVASMEECCKLCQQYKPPTEGELGCNVWVYCGFK